MSRSPDAPTRPLLMLAPNLEYPARNGSDVTLVELAPALSARAGRVVVVASRETVTYEHGREVQRAAHGGAMRSRRAAGVRTLVRRSHYYREKFNTPGFTREARTHLAKPEYEAVFHSYLTTADLVAPSDVARPHVVWSHNDEFKWFEDLRDSAKGPLGRAVATASLRWLRRFLGPRRHALTLLHVTEADRDGWERHVPGHRGTVVPIGVSLRGEVAPPRQPGGGVRLIFSAALGVRMNLDALTHFAERFAPALRARLGDALQVHVVGSNPLPEVVALCAREGWALAPNVSEDEMDAQFRAALFSLLPFPYATGAKLKLLKSVAYGVPVLATPTVGAQADLVVPPSLLSDDPDEWVRHVVATRDAGIPADQRRSLRAIAEDHSWGTTADRVLEAIRPSPPIHA